MRSHNMKTQQTMINKINKILFWNETSESQRQFQQWQDKKSVQFWYYIASCVLAI
jgi:hypothetical protein